MGVLMEELIEIKIVQELPMLVIKRELTEFDLAPVTEKENSIRFMFDDDAWESNGDSFTMKLRFRRAVELDKELRDSDFKKKIKMSDKHYMELANICKVFKTEAETEEQKEKKEEVHYINSLQKLNESIDEFNMTTMMMGVTK
jgi:hypothetical protein